MIDRLHLDDSALWDYALATAAAGERARVEAHLEVCADCRGALTELRTAAGLLATALPPTAPSPRLRARLLDALDAAGAHAGLAAMAPRLGAFFDVDPATAAAMLQRLGDDDAWRDAGIPGLRARPARSGPACAGAYSGFLRLAPGSAFPAHDHVGPERTLILAGGLRQHDGLELHPGDQQERAPGQRHALVALPGVDCIAAVIQRGGLTFGVRLD